MRNPFQKWFEGSNPFPATTYFFLANLIWSYLSQYFCILGSSGLSMTMPCGLGLPSSPRVTKVTAVLRMLSFPQL